MNFEEARTLIDELHRENQITDNEYNTLRDCIDELEDVAKNARCALRGMF